MASERAKAEAEHAAEQRKDYIRALEEEKDGLKRRIAGSTDADEQKRLEARVKSVDESIAHYKKAPAGRSTSGSSTS